MELKKSASGMDYLKTLAISRIVLDNFDNIQSSWVTQGPKIGQMALYYGANDMGSTMIEENVVRAAGTSYSMTEEEIRRLIADSGHTPQRRNMRYQYA
jgi:cyclic dehypoxanthinyl futalosine synthase